MYDQQVSMAGMDPSGFGPMDMLDMGPQSHPGFDGMGPDPVMMHMGQAPQQRMMAQQPQTPQRMAPGHMMHDQMVVGHPHMQGTAGPGPDHMSSWFDGDM